MLVDFLSQDSLFQMINTFFYNSSLHFNVKSAVGSFFESQNANITIDSVIMHSACHVRKLLNLFLLTICESNHTPTNTVRIRARVRLRKEARSNGVTQCGLVFHNFSKYFKRLSNRCLQKSCYKTRRRFFLFYLKKSKNKVIKTIRIYNLLVEC